MPKKKKEVTQTAKFVFRTDELTYEQLGIVSYLKERSMNYILNKALKEYLDKIGDGL